MPTATTLITRALKLLGVLEASESAQTADLTDGLAVLNALIEAWPGQRRFPDLTTDVALPPGWERAVVANLALELSPYYGREPNEVVVAMARSALAMIKRLAWQPTEAKMDPMFVRSGGYDLYRGS